MNSYAFLMCSALLLAPVALVSCASAPAEDPEAFVCTGGKVPITHTDRAAPLCCWPGQQGAGGTCVGALQCYEGWVEIAGACVPDDPAQLDRACQGREGEPVCQERMMRACDQGDKAKCEALDGSVESEGQMALWQRRCQRGVAAACIKAAAFARKAGVHPGARGIQKLACGVGDEAACYELARMQRMGLFGERSAGEARARYRQLCEQGALKVQACFVLGQMLERAEGGQPDLTAAARLWEPLCANQGHLEACSELGLLRELGAGEVPRDVASAKALYERACLGGVAKGCARLGELHLWGRGVQESATEAMALFQQACSLQEGQGCLRVGHGAQFGWVGKPDFKQARAAFEQACEMGNTEGCAGKGLLLEAGLGGEKDPKAAFSLYQELCERAPRQGCTNLGYLYEFGRGIPQDIPRAKKLYEASCEQGSEDACRRLVELGRR